MTNGCTRWTLAVLSTLLLATAPAAGQLVADFSADVTAGGNPLTVQFSDTSSGATTSTWLWDFGDGSTGNGAQVSHTYTTPGSYDVRLTALAGLFDTDTVLKQGLITVAPGTLSASFQASVTSGVNPLTVQFSDTSEGAVTGWLWDFGDGTTSTEQNPSHEFYADTSDGPTLHTVTLTTFLGGQSETVVMGDLIEVQPAPLQADFSAVVTSGTNPLKVQFIDRSMGAVDGWHWQFGDGGSHDVKHGFHIFSVEDNATTSWDVTLTASIGGQQDTITKPAFITVEPADIDLALVPSVSEGVGHLTIPLKTVAPLPEGTQLTWTLGDVSYEVPSIEVTRFGEGGLPTDYDLTVSARLWNQVETLELQDAYTVAPRVLGAEQLVDPGFLPVTDCELIDWDEDGDLDVVAAYGTDDLVTLALNDGSGAFGPAQVLVSGSYLTLCDAVDLDGDGHLDLFLSGPFELAWLPGGPDGGPLQTIVTGVTVVGLRELVDIDGDGDLDIAGVAELAGSEMVVWREHLDGAGSFGEPLPIVSGVAIDHLAGGDLDGDGDGDLAVSGAELRWLENTDGIGGAWSVHEFSPAVAWPDDLLLADLERDGDLDVLIATRVNGAGTVAWARNTGAGQFAFLQHTSLLTQQRLDHLALADLDLDGDDDLLATSRWYQTGLSLPGQVTWYEDLTGQLDFAPGELAAPSERLYNALVPGDVDGDGDPDLLLGRNWLDALTWVENTWLAPDWAPLGPRLAGSDGPPLLQAFGALTAGSEVTLALSNALPGSTASLVLGTRALSAPFKGGVLVPAAEVLVPFLVGAQGDLLVQSSWPAGVPAGVPLFAQAWIVDGAAPAGLSASNGLQGLTAD